MSRILMWCELLRGGDTIYHTRKQDIKNILSEKVGGILDLTAMVV